MGIRRILGVGLVALGLSATLTAPALAEEPAPMTRIADRSYPGIQMILNQYGATVVVPVPEITNAASASLEDQITRQVNSGVIPQTQEAVIEALVKEITANPLTYLTPSAQTRSTNAQIGMLGTGFVVTPDGIILTAAHVVSMSDSELKQAIAKNGLQKFVEEDIKSFQSSEGGSGATFTQDQQQRLAQAIAVFNANFMNLSDIQQQVSVRLGVSDKVGGKTGDLRPVEVISVGQSYPDKDFAILKVEGLENLPTIPVGDDSQVVAGTTFYVAGFTGASTFFPGASEDAINTPAVTEGPVTAVKSNDKGVPYFQTQAPAGHGNSGGPVLNDKGEAVGILVAGSIEDSGETVQGQEWVLPIRVVQSELTSKNITPKAGTITPLYNSALEDFYTHHYKAALPKFQKVANLYPAHPYATSFIQKSQTAIEAGQDQTPMSSGLLLALGAAGLLTLLVLGGGTFAIVRMRSKRTPVAVASPRYAVPPGGYPAGGSPLSWQQTQPMAQAPPQQQQAPWPQQQQAPWPQQQAPWSQQQQAPQQQAPQQQPPQMPRPAPPEDQPPQTS